MERKRREAERAKRNYRKRKEELARYKAFYDFVLSENPDLVIRFNENYNPPQVQQVIPPTVLPPPPQALQVVPPTVSSSPQPQQVVPPTVSSLPQAQQVVPPTVSLTPQQIFQDTLSPSPLPTLKDLLSLDLSWVDDIQNLPDPNDFPNLDLDLY